MTKHVRVENADAGHDFGVVVEVWDAGQGGAPDRLAETHKLLHPTAMTPETLYITDTRYLKVREAKPGEI